MASENIIQPTYVNWKATRTTLAGTTYYLKRDLDYIGILVQEVDGIINVYLVELFRTPQDYANPSSSTIDFETNIIPTATQVVSIDDAIAKVIA